MSYISIGKFSNQTDVDLSINLEIHCEEIILNPGHEIELFIENKLGALPVNILYHEKSLQIYPHTSDPDWLIHYNGRKIVPGYPTRLSEY